MTLTLAVIGSSKSGKTTLIEYIVSKLSGEGYRVGTIKHIHLKDFTFDTSGKDTWRHRRAGADIVLGVAEKELCIFNRKELKFDKIEDLLALIRDRDLDLIIIEGFKNLIMRRRDVTKVITAKNLEELKNLLNSTVEPIIAVMGPITRDKSKIQGVETPIIDLYSEGEKLIELIKQLISR